MRRHEVVDLDSEDDGDGQLQSFILPKGFQVAAAPPPAQLDCSDLAARKVLVGRTILFNWAVVGWCEGLLRSTNTDGRLKTKGGAHINFFIYYTIDQEERKHALLLDTYGQGGVGSWVLLESE